MKAAEGKMGRVFVIRLEDGDVVPACLEEFAAKNNVQAGFVNIIGGMWDGNIVTGPRRSEEMPPDPMLTPVEGAHEVVCTGVIALDEEGQPRLHLHGALGRGGTVIGGCLRPGLKTWLVGEVIMCEILGVESRRIFDERSRFPLLRP